MKIIINVFYGKKLVEVPVRIINHFKIDECWYVYDKTKPKVKSKIHLLDRDDVYWRADYHTDLNKLIPLDDEIIKQMTPCEVEILKMMDRYEFENPLSYEER